jgi:hypothetical protein
VDGYRAAVGGGPRQAGKLGVHDFRAANLLVERRLADVQVHLGAEFPEDRLLASHDRLDRPVAGGVVLQERVDLGDGPRVGGSLQQRRNLLGLVGGDLRGGRLEDEVVAPSGGQDVGVVAVPAKCVTRVGQESQQGLLLPLDPVLHEQVAELFATDAALAALDPADL